MLILGIDPGTETTGYAILQETNSQLILIDYGCIKTKNDKPHHKRLNEIADDINAIIKKYKPNICAIEKLFFSKNIKTAMKVSESRGVILEHVSRQGLEIYEYTPNEIKSSVTGSGKADKIQVQKMVKIILNLKTIPKPDDAADAIAIALTHNQNSKIKQL